MPGFFGEQATRLLRERWSSAQELAEELFAMSGLGGPAETDRPLVLYRNGDEPAITIIDNSGGSSPPIRIVGGNNGTDSVDPGNYQCCGGGGGGGSPTVPHQNQEDETSGPGGGGGDVNPAPPPGPTPRRIFTATLTVRIRANPPDTFGFNGQMPSFTAQECKLYNPPSIPAPTTAFAFGDITSQLNNYLSQPGLAPFLAGYDVITDTVSPPGAVC